MKRTRWFRGSVPVRSGAYEVNIHNGKVYLSWWNKEQGYWGAVSGTAAGAMANRGHKTGFIINAWRGVAR